MYCYFSVFVTLKNFTSHYEGWISVLSSYPPSGILTLSTSTKTSPVCVLIGTLLAFCRHCVPFTAHCLYLVNRDDFASPLPTSTPWVPGVCLTFTCVVVYLHLLCLAVYILPSQVRLLEPAFPSTPATSSAFCFIILLGLHTPFSAGAPTDSWRHRLSWFSPSPVTF